MTFAILESASKNTLLLVSLHRQRISLYLAIASSLILAGSDWCPDLRPGLCIFAQFHCFIEGRQRRVQTQTPHNNCHAIDSHIKTVPFAHAVQPAIGKPPPQLFVSIGTDDKRRKILSIISNENASSLIRADSFGCNARTYAGNTVAQAGDNLTLGWRPYRKGEPSAVTIRRSRLDQRHYRRPPNPHPSSGSILRGMSAPIK